MASKLRNRIFSFKVRLFGAPKYPPGQRKEIIRQLRRSGYGPIGARLILRRLPHEIEVMDEVHRLRELADHRDAQREKKGE